MYPDTDLYPTTPCPDVNGTLPSCAPLAVPYVPRQQSGAVYGRKEALENGTLFPGLNLPFFLKPDAPNVEQTPLAELQALEFVLNELGLYLDTHPDDREAFSLYQNYAALEQTGRKTYEMRYGPLTQYAVSNGTSYRAWLRDPWPWNEAEGRED